MSALTLQPASPTALADRLALRIAACPLPPARGRVTAVKGALIACTPMTLRLGELVTVLPRQGDCGDAFTAEVIALQPDHALLMPHASTRGVSLASEVIVHAAKKSAGHLVASDVSSLCGRVLDAHGNAIDDCPPLAPLTLHNTPPPPINPLRRVAASAALHTGVRAIDLFTPIARGQRIGIFAGSGVGKSQLLAMLCRHAHADVIVVALVGERGREVADFVRTQRATGNFQRTVVIAATAEQPAVLRRQAVWTANGIAEAFRARGQHVLLVVDSITRLAQAQRDIALSAGEPMAARGFPPSVFGLIPQVLERAGELDGEGSITGIYTVLVEGDDFNEPVSDAMRATLDGHIVLERALAARSHFPAIDILASVSRLENALLSPDERRLTSTLRRTLATWRDARDMIELGAYVAGSNRTLDAAIALKPGIDAFLQQETGEPVAGRDATWRAAQQLLAASANGNAHEHH